MPPPPHVISDQFPDRILAKVACQELTSSLRVFTLLPSDFFVGVPQGSILGQVSLYATHFIRHPHLTRSM